MSDDEIYPFWKSSLGEKMILLLHWFIFISWEDFTFFKFLKPYQDDWRDIVPGDNFGLQVLFGMNDGR